MSFLELFKTLAEKTAYAVGAVIAPKATKRARDLDELKIEAKRAYHLIVGQHDLNHVDPFDVGQSLGLSNVETLAVFELMTRDGLVEPVFVVKDDDGEELAAFESRSDIPAAVEDRYLNEVHVGPENIFVEYSVQR